MNKNELDTKFARLEELSVENSAMVPLYREDRKRIETSGTKSEFDAFEAECSKIYDNDGHTDSTDERFVRYAMIVRGNKETDTLKKELYPLVRARAELALEVAGELRRQLPTSYSWVGTALKDKDDYDTRMYYYSGALQVTDGRPGGISPIPSEVLYDTDEQFKERVAEDIKNSDSGVWSAPFNNEDALTYEVVKPQKRGFIAEWKRQRAINKASKNLANVVVNSLYGNNSRF